MSVFQILNVEGIEANSGLFIDTSGLVGVGVTSSLLANLHVRGTGSPANDILRIEDISTNVVVYIDDVAAGVAIGSTNLSGTVYTNPKLIVNTGSGIPGLMHYNSFGVELITFTNVSDSLFGNASNHDLSLITNNIEVVKITAGGNVGINHLTPPAKLTIVGSGNTVATHSLRIANTSSDIMMNIQDDGFVGLGTITRLNGFGLGNFGLTMPALFVDMQDTTASANLSIRIGNFTTSTIIGTYNYTHALDGTKVAAIEFDDATGNVWFGGYGYSGQKYDFVLNYQDVVSGQRFAIGSGNHVQDSGANLWFYGASNSASNSQQAYASIEALKENALDANFAAYLKFGISDSSSPTVTTEAMRITSAQHLAIGLTVPLARLDVRAGTTGDIFRLNNSNFLFADKMLINNDGSFYSGSINGFGGSGTGTFRTDHLDYTLNTAFSTYLAFTNNGLAANISSYGIIGGPIGSSDVNFKLKVLNTDDGSLGSVMNVVTTANSTASDGTNYDNYSIKVVSSGTQTNTGAGTFFKTGLYVDVTNGDVNKAIETVGGTVTIGDLAGTGNRVVEADSTGKLVAGAAVIGSAASKVAFTFTPGTPGSPNTITHGLGTTDFSVTLWDVTAGDIIYAKIDNASTTAVDVTFTVNPAGNVRIVIIG